MLSWSTLLTVHEQERHSAQNGHKIQRKAGHILDNAVTTERLKRSYKLALDGLLLAVPGGILSSVFYEMFVTLYEERRVKNLSQRRFKEKRASEEGENEDSLSSKEQEGQDSTQKSSDDAR